MPEHPLQHARDIGKKLRTARKQAGVSLRELADKAEVSASMLSQIENGKAFPSVRSLYSIATALSLPVDHFFPNANDDGLQKDEQPTEKNEGLTASEMREARITGVRNGRFEEQARSLAPVVHVEARPTIELKGGVVWARLTSGPEEGAEFLEITYAPGATSGNNFSHHGGREFGLILEGELTVELGFEHHMLRPGDSIIFNSTTPHRLTNSSPNPTRAIWVVLERKT
jgi:transcriptional regulator with XRE-family HTH domain